MRPFMLALLAVMVTLATGCTQRRKTVPVPPTAGDGSRASAKDSGAAVVLRGGRVMTATGVIYDRADVLIVGSRIAEIGPSIDPPKGAQIVDVSGATVTPGIIDTHSHVGVYPAPSLVAHADGNEAIAPTTAGVRAADAYWPQDPQIDRARAGGVTTMQVLPGSANLIGGRTFTVKTYPRALSANDARFEGAPEGLKMACGENPKRVYAEKGGPSTRMGNVAGFRTAFAQAQAYRRKWQRYRDALKRDESQGKDDDDDEPPEPPDRDLALETLAQVLSGELLVHNHCYRADEMITMMSVAEEFGFEIRSFHHAAEAYKIADVLAARGVAASMWADWWGFKAEAFDGVRENAAMVSAAGGRAIIHSDSAIGGQRLNQEAAKAMYAGRRAGLDIPDDEALRWITAHPAWALGVDAQVGTLEPGKQADVVVWSGDPFSVYTLAQQVYIEGELVFDRAKETPQDGNDFEVGLEKRSR